MIKGFEIGTTVALNAEAAELFLSLANRILEVVDSRLTSGGYIYGLVSAGAPMGSERVWFSADDLHEVR